MDIRQAFNDLLTNKWDDLPSKDKYLWKYRFNNMEISIEKMTEILKKYGYKKTHTERWKAK